MEKLPRAANQRDRTMKNWQQLFVIASFVGVTACATSHGAGEPPDTALALAPPGGDYQNVSALVALPAFIPGMGALFVQPSTLPAGPFLAYDRDNKLVSTVYMIPLAQMEQHVNFVQLATPGRPVVATDIVYNAGHPGVAEPHYHIVLWHVPADQAKLK